MNFCEVIGCDPSFDRDRVYHRFPSDSTRYKEWLKRIGKNSKNLTVKSAVCSRHFHDKDYYTGGKRLLPNAIPTLRLGISPTNRKTVSSKVIKSKPNKGQNLGKPNTLKKSKANVRTNKLRDTQQQQAKIVKSPKINMLSDTLRNKSSIREICTISSRNVKQAKNTPIKLKSERQISIKPNKSNKTSTKFPPKLCKRIAVSVSKTPPTTLRNNKQSSSLLPKSRNLSLNNKNAGLMLRIGSQKSKESKLKSKNSLNIKNVISKPSYKCKIPIQKSKESKLKPKHSLNTKNVVSKPSYKCKIPIQKSKESKLKSKNSLNTKNVISKPSYGCKIPIQKSKESKLKSNNSLKTKNLISKQSYKRIKEMKTRSLQQLKTKDCRILAPQESGTRSKRIIRKRKRLLSDDDSTNNENEKSKILKVELNKITIHKSELTKSKPKDPKNGLGISKNGVTKCQPNMCNTSKNLSGIEKVISEMQNKIQMLEKKAILDEMKIETFKKALIRQRSTDLHILMDKMDTELLLRMDLLYLEYNPQKICRLCLQVINKQKDLIPLFGPMTNKTLLRLIKKATNVEVTEEDGMPSSICIDCLEDVNRVDWLQRRTQKSNSLINKFLAMKQNPTKTITEPQSGSEVKRKTAEKFESPFVSFPASSTNVEEAAGTFKIEDVFSLDSTPISFEDITIKQEMDSDKKIGSKHDLKTTYSITTKKSLTKTRCKSCTRIFKNPRLLFLHARYCSKRFQCSECNKYFLNFSLYRKHKQKRFGCYCADNLRYCSDCNISFRWKWQLVFHILRHSSQNCMLCGDTVHSMEQLQHHLIEAHQMY